MQYIKKKTIIVRLKPTLVRSSWGSRGGAGIAGGHGIPLLLLRARGCLLSLSGCCCCCSCSCCCSCCCSCWPLPAVAGDGGSLVAGGQRLLLRRHESLCHSGLGLLPSSLPDRWSSPFRCLVNVKRGPSLVTLIIKVRFSDSKLQIICR